MVRSDEFYYNMRDWVKPVLESVPTGAKNGMDTSPELTDALGSDSVQLKRLEVDIRERIAQHLQDEMKIVIDKMQRLIDIVTRFSLDSMNSLQEAVSSISNGGEEIEWVGNVYLDSLIQRAKVAIKKIIDELDYSISQNVDDHLSGKVFQAMAIRIAKDVLKGSELVSMEHSVLEQVKLVLDSLFSDAKGEIEKGVMSDLADDLHRLIKQRSADLSGNEDKFQKWVLQLTTNAVQGAKPQIHLLRNYAREVITDACKLCHDISYQAYSYFSEHRVELGSVWDRIEKIVQMILDENQDVDL